MIAVSSFPAAAADSASETSAAAAAAPRKEASPLGMLGVFVKLLNGLLEKENEDAGTAPQADPGGGQADTIAALAGPVTVPAPAPAELPALPGSAFLPAAAGAPIPPAQPEDSPPAEAVSFSPPAGSYPGVVGVPGEAVDPAPDSGFIPVDSALPEAEPAPAMPAETTGEKIAPIAAAAMDPKSPAGPDRPAIVRVSADSSAAAPSGDPANTAHDRGAQPVAIGPPATMPAWSAPPPAEEHLHNSALAFGYRLTPLAPHAAAGRQAAAPVAAVSGAAPFQAEPAPPNSRPAAPQANHPAAHEPIAPEIAGTKEAAATEVRWTSGIAAGGNIPQPLRPAEPAGPEARPATPAAPPSAEPATAPGSAHEIRLQVAGKSQRVDVRVTERAGEVQLAVRTPDARLAGWLREDLGSLSARLEQAGFRAEAWQPAAWTAGQRAPSAEMRAASAAPGEELNPQNHSQQQQPDPQRRPHAREAGTREPAPEFSGVLESLD